jgi:transcriptional regulator GlxA family with amidase domain
MHRIWHAQHLLTSSQMKIRDIASACGFNSPNRFYAAFKRIVGQQPADFRETLPGVMTSAAARRNAT